jgi:hypothetical protein
MIRLLRGWGFPAALLMVWALSVAYSVYAIGAMESAVQTAGLNPAHAQ